MCVCCFALIIASREREALQLRESGGAFGAVSLSLVGRVPACSGTLGTQTAALNFCPRPACWAPCEKTYLPLAVTIPLPLPSSSCALRHRWVSSGMHRALCREPCSTLLKRWWGNALLPLEMWISEAESSPGHQEMVWKGKGKSKGQKGLIKRGKYVFLYWAASGSWSVD